MWILHFADNFFVLLKNLHAYAATIFCGDKRKRDPTGNINTITKIYPRRKEKMVEGDTLKLGVFFFCDNREKPIYSIKYRSGSERPEGRELI